MTQTIRTEVERATAMLSIAAAAAGIGVEAWQISVHAAVWIQLLVLALTLAMAVLGATIAATRLRAAATEREELRVRAERQRVAQDLHDGLTQDLAVIVAHADRLSSGLGEDHPVAVAARRALTVARGTMLDLAASAEPTTLDALRAVADEVQTRYGVRIDVRGVDDPRSELGPDERHEVVRIAREAMVNAVRHGHARRVSVTLGDRDGGDMLLRVTDDGIGIDPGRGTPRGTGLGVAHMRRRAGSLGAQLVMRRRDAGGTEIRIRG